ncbi:hypothetical protein [Bavariicoccus seileri]|uniref:hypothetical protein n=1 Tax=Bavariicoccus seileri TaxID=549685 RepID=UPI0003B7076C|nr:hypothetical protein [Bavariicoccus seileri]
MNKLLTIILESVSGIINNYINSENFKGFVKDKLYLLVDLIVDAVIKQPTTSKTTSTR